MKLDINMPGFTAEASVYKTRGHYRVSSMTSDLAGGRGALQAAGDGLVQQKISNWWQCWYLGRCIICCSWYWCWWACYGGIE
jgi:hypothetical protein